MAKQVHPLPGSQARQLGARIRALRENLDLDQTQFARVVGVSQQALSSWERGVGLKRIDVGMRLDRMMQERGI